MQILAKGEIVGIGRLGEWDEGKMDGNICAFYGIKAGGIFRGIWADFLVRF